MPPHDLTRLNGQTVLVKTTADRRNPPVALRGTIEARLDRAGTPVVKIVLEYPDMSNTASHEGVISLDGAGIDRLMAGERNGAFEYTIDQPLEPQAESEGSRASDFRNSVAGVVDPGANVAVGPARTGVSDPGYNSI